MISAIIPTYRNPAYLDLCLRSATENQQHEDTEIIVIVDGYPEESETVLAKYDGISVLSLPKNMGMQYALNLGVMNATNSFVVILNDDNVFCSEWDSRICNLIKDRSETIDNEVITINQFEPGGNSIYDFVSPSNLSISGPEKPKDSEKWKSLTPFPYIEWLKTEIHISHFSQPREPTDNDIAGDKTNPIMYPEPVNSQKGKVFPFIVSKRAYQMLGGFDTFYDSPFFCDLDWWVKVELAGMKCYRWYEMTWLHFGSMATKNREDAEAHTFKQSESVAAKQFQYKWGYIPSIVESAKNWKEHGYTKFPLHANEIKGIKFRL